MPNDHRPTNLPWIQGQEDDYNAATLGGRVIRMLAGGSLNVGDAVYLSAAKTVNKSATAGNHNKRVGIVIGGTKTYDQVIVDSAVYGSLQAAAEGEYVLVCFLGACLVIADGTIGLGTAIALSSTVAGRVRAATEISVSGAALTGAPGGGVLSGSVDAGTLAVSALTKGTLAVAAGAVPVESSAVNGDILTGVPGGGVLSGAPSNGTLAVSAPTIGTLAVSAPADAGDGNNRIIGMMLEDATIGQVKTALIYLA